MAQHNIQVGDIVRLKSGGPDMVVVNTGPTAFSIECQWFAATDTYGRDQHLRHELFRAETLVLGKERPAKVEGRIDPEAVANSARARAAYEALYQAGTMTRNESRGQS